MGTFTLHWDCPECCEDSGSSSSPQPVKCDYSVLKVTIHATREADPTIGQPAIDVYVTGYTPSENFSIGDAVFNYGFQYMDCTCIISQINEKKCFETMYNPTDPSDINSYTGFWDSLTDNQKWGAV